MGKKIRVLNINYVSSEYGGVPVFLINVFRNIDHDKFQFDFLTPDTTSYNPWRKEIELAGGNIYEFHIDSNSASGKLKFGRRLRLFLSDCSYDIVHVNCGGASFDCITTLAAKSQGSKVVVHSHNAEGRKWWKEPVVFFMKRIMQRRADVLCACSTKAARNIFTSRKINKGEVIIINNGIDIEKFRFNNEIRSRVRREFLLENRFVVGHVGRFVEQKNHTFLIDIFAEIHQALPSAILMLIGSGELELEIREKVHYLNLDDQVLFLGQRDDVADLYQAMDVFLFPSLFEGLPISLVEAQVSGLPCCISNTITKEVDLTQLIHRISLDANALEWAQAVLSVEKKSDQRHSYDQNLRDAGFGIDAASAQISRIYENLV